MLGGRPLELAALFDHKPSASKVSVPDIVTGFERRWHSVDNEKDHSRKRWKDGSDRSHARYHADCFIQVMGDGADKNFIMPDNSSELISSISDDQP